MAPPFAAVYFDCDSTLATVEGIDELLGRVAPDVRAEVLALTRQAMEGTLPLAEVYETRLAKIAPTRAMLESVSEVYVRHLTPGAAETVAALQSLGKVVGVVSGGLRIPVAALAAHLGIPDENVHAVPVLFDAQGNYVDFDRRSPLWRNGGKVDVMRALPPGHRPTALVGDGITDLEAAVAVDRFVGFGGVEVRTAVKARSSHWVEEPDLTAVLPHLLTDDELMRRGP